MHSNMHIFSWLNLRLINTSMMSFIVSYFVDHMSSILNYVACRNALKNLETFQNVTKCPKVRRNKIQYHDLKIDACWFTRPWINEETLFVSPRTYKRLFSKYRYCVFLDFKCLRIYFYLINFEAYYIFTKPLIFINH